MCVWVPAAVCLGRGAVCVGEKCVFVFAEGNGLCVCVCVCVCVVCLCLRIVGAAEKGGPGCHSAIRLTGAPSSGPGSSDCRLEETK